MFKWRLGADHVTDHYLNQWLSSSMMHLHITCLTFSRFYVESFWNFAYAVLWNSACLCSTVLETSSKFPVVEKKNEQNFQGGIYYQVSHKEGIWNCGDLGISPRISWDSLQCVEWGNACCQMVDEIQMNWLQESCSHGQLFQVHHSDAVHYVHCISVMYLEK